MSLVANEIVNNKDGTDRRNESIQDIQPAHEVVVQPKGCQRTHGTVDKHQVTFGQFGDIGQPR